MGQSGGELAVLREVAVRAGAKTLLDRVSWTIRRGERWVVLGGNGAGKTTLAKVLAGLVSPDAGSVELLGTPLAEHDPAELRSQVGFASFSVDAVVDDKERVLDVVTSAALGEFGDTGEDLDPEDRHRGALLLRQLGARPLASRAYGTLSEGERKRVLVARALMPDPELLVLDEPAAGLDLGAREALLRRLTRLAVDPAAPVTVLITHHVEEIPAGTTHVLLLGSGRVLAAGPLADTLTAETLGACFGLPLVLDVAAGRYTARASLLPPRRHRTAATGR